MNRPVSVGTADLKRWATARAQLCRAGIASWRSDPADGPCVAFFTMRTGVVKMHRTLADLEEYAREVHAPRCVA